MSAWRWSLTKKARRVQREICGRFYIDRHPDRARSIILAGAGRSGTTWLADLFASQAPSRVMFEPFHPQLVPEYSQFNYFQYMRPRDRDHELEAFVDAVLSGRIRNRWIDTEVEALLPRRRIIKAIRACLLLRWIRDRFPEVPILLLIRHPCAVVSSRMKLDWATDRDIEPFLSQPELIEDFLGDRMELIEGASSAEEKHAVVWCVSNLIPLRQFEDAELPVVFFEDLAAHPDSVIPSLFAAARMDYDSSVFRYHRRPSTTSGRWSAPVRGDAPAAAWRGDLSDDQVANVMGIVRGFGLDSLYGTDGTPTGVLPTGATRLFEDPGALEVG